ncbi:MAG: hypothetical protein ACRCZD_02140 [Phycicoccus sp.]
MDLPPLTHPTLASEVLAPRAQPDVPQEIGLAMRADRCRLGLSRRAYARRRGWSLSRVIRMETTAADVELCDVIDSLAGTPFVLTLCRRQPPADPPPPGPGGTVLTAPGPAVTPLAVTSLCAVRDWRQPA